MASADIEFIKEGGKLAMYLQSGKFKHDRWFWLEGDHLSWDKKKKAPGKANKSEPLAGAKDAPAIKSAQEWFKMIDADGSGAIDEEEFATLYKKARGENRVCKVIDSPSIAESECAFSVGAAGIDDAKE